MILDITAHGPYHDQCVVLISYINKDVLQRPPFRLEVGEDSLNLTWTKKKKMNTQEQL